MSIEEKLKKIEKWWNGENKNVLVQVSILKDKNFTNLNNIWNKENEMPDFEKFVNVEIKNVKRFEYLGISYPALPHEYGSRGTPMVMCAYLGCKIIFKEDTIWFEKFIDDWQKVKFKFNIENFWVRASKKLIEKQIEKINDELLLWLPDFGDALTCFSLMRGIENFLIDIIEIPNIIFEKIDEFISVWIETHKFFHAIYRKKLIGDASWLLWAPGKTYACQSDFSVMISPKLFEKFVVYELEKLKNYLEYIIWHLDGPEQIKHLDILLSLPYIKGFQISYGAGKPTCASSLWIPNIKKILEKNKNVYLYANNWKEFEILIKNFPSGRVLINCGTINLETHEGKQFLNMVEPYL